MMVRKVITLAVGLSITHVTLLILEDTGAIPPGGLARAAVSDQSTPSPVSFGQTVLLDTFDDNAKGAMWQVFADDAPNCGMKEVNQRLELEATSLPVDASAGYIAKGWRLDPKRDFSARADYYYDLVSSAGGWLSLGVTCDAVSPWENNALVGVGCRDRLVYHWCSVQTGFTVDSWIVQRFRNNGTLYVSYNAGVDELYLSFAGYGRDYAWQILPNVLGGQWNGRPVFIWLAGGANGLAVPSGRAYLDNFTVEKGRVIEASLAPVYRFWSASLGRYFYTINEAEKDGLIAEFKHVWAYQGIAYRAYSDNVDPDVNPVYRFWSDRLGGHFYTIDASEKDWLISEHSHMWAYEGVAFYAYSVGKEPTWARPVYRFWSPSRSTHFYTMSEAERNDVLTKYSHIWEEEGIAWYANE